MKKQILKSQFIALGLLLTAGGFTACKDDENVTVPGASYGPEVKIGNGTARSFIKFDNAGKASTIGFTMTRGVLANLPHEGDHNSLSYLLALPAEKQKTAYDHITIDWNPHGHMPNGVYDKPHFDMHFYMINQAKRETIKVGTPEMEKLPGAGFLPVNYASSPGEGEPKMGKHWIDVTSPELKGKPFTTTFIYGSYDGHVIFHEPMMTHEWLSTARDTVITLPKPITVENGNAFPGKYAVTYDKAKQVYTVSMELIKN